MPRYNATGIRMFLGATSLSDTTCEEIKRNKADASRNSERFEQRLRDSEELREDNVPFPGDIHGFRLNFLQNVPFLQVQAGRDFFGKKATRDRREDMSPQALSLHVLLSEQTFITSVHDRKPRQLMIDVFFNGTLASSVLVHLRDISSGAKTMHQIFAGHREGFLIERPWIIVPPGQETDGSLRGKRKTIGVKERWGQLSTALINQADERGFDALGERPPSARYLESLAIMDMPVSVSRMQRAGGKAFGIIDVVVTAGQGQKVAAGYLSRPLRLPDPRYSLTSPQRRRPVPVAVVKAEVDSKPSNNRPDQELLAFDVDAEGETDSEFEQEPSNPSASLPLSHSLPSFLPQQLAPSSAFSVTADHNNSVHVGLPSALDQASSFDVSIPARHGLQSTAASTSESSLAGHWPYVNPQASSGQFLHFAGNAPVPTTVASMSDSQSPHLFGADAWPMQNIAYPAHLSRRLNLQGHQRNPVYPYALLPTQPSLQQAIPAQSRGPLPPIGLFSAPPRSKSSHVRHPHSGRSRFSVFLSRFILTGKRGKPIIDHRWVTPQRITITGHGEARDSSVKLKREMRPNDGKVSLSNKNSTKLRSSSRLRHSGTEQMRLTTPPPSSPEHVGSNMITSDIMPYQAATSLEKLAKRLSNPHELRTTLGYSHESLEPGDTSNEMDMKPTLDIPKAKSSTPDALHLNLAKSILGAQGPKATPFVFDNPEELLRRRARGAKTALKNSSHVNMSTRLTTPRSAVHNVKFRKRSPSTKIPPLKSSSSSLSSAPSSPKHKASHAPPANPVQLIPQVDTLSHSQPFTDTSNQYQNPPLPRRNPHTPSVRPKQQVKATTASLNIPATRPKRKVSTARSFPSTTYKSKEERRMQMYNPDTSGNPQLNQDCIICFAQSVKGSKPMLRQVKSEKQGVFTEDEVVVGMRFFVAE